uniref:Uncharacterized protein n=1 Tax=Anopheles quadriannulatus TaxID=34691 RepID=A0A182XQ61_ANOQN
MLFHYIKHTTHTHKHDSKIHSHSCNATIINIQT